MRKVINFRKSGSDGVHIIHKNLLNLFQEVTIPLDHLYNYAEER